ncbi:MAG TPA: sodium:calcium antiporter [Gemmatimonadales bacterium]|jgi:cation:H+ antiporter
MTVALAVFFAAGLLLVVAGTFQTRAADAIAEATGLGRLFVGTLLLAAATSMPELATDVSAVRLGAPNLAAGDLFGSSLANMLILAAMGYVIVGAPVFRAATPVHAVTACLAIVLNAAAGVFVLARLQHPGWPVGLESLLLAAGFLAGMRIIYTHRGDGGPVEASHPPRWTPQAREAVRRFLLASAGVLIAAPAFAWSAKRIAELSGLGTTFVGTWLVGLATSLPELVTAVAALRLGAVDLAVGNLFGSNAFNMAVFLPMDLAYPGGSIFGVLDPAHALTALLAVVLMALGLAAIVLRSEGRRSLLEPGSALMIAVYLSGLMLLYLYAMRERGAGV